ncbi:hypothetical protein [Gloeothece verrucosa]|uniref:Uncharacterized protein n=1 Tax=Gloeothece verrucosa (strain PCC 7822) TaxID=497965 RepID=E0UJN2_GLOV7|nr:hypothetical protein [Gloeothece verrucosa]ADN12276.1 hypothetical protein Cyan7822_0227 [Gloeothece verrucosa PCC 7822]
MGELSISTQNINGRKVDSYLFWLRVKNLLSTGFFVTVFGSFLLMVMFYRFHGLDNKSFSTFEKAQENSLLENHQKI